MEVVNRKKKPASGDDNLTPLKLPDKKMNSANKVALLAKILVWVPQFRIIRLNKLSILLFKIRLKI